jgi:hypothetical protein
LSPHARGKGGKGGARGPAGSPIAAKPGNCPDACKRARAFTSAAPLFGSRLEARSTQAHAFEA